MRLHVGELGAEELLGAIAGEILDDVDVFAAAVVAAAGITLGVLVGQDTALRLQHRARHEVLRGDHLEGVALPSQLPVHRRRDLGVELSQGCGVDVGHVVSLDARGAEESASASVGDLPGPG